jgi:hypothetical protein
MSLLQFSWEKSTDPDPEDFVYYEFQLSTDTSFGIGITSTVILLNTGHVILPGVLSTGTTYYWRVNAVSTISGLTVSNQQYNTVSVITYGPEEFDLLTPTGTFKTSYRSTITFNWQDTTSLDPGDTVQYVLQYSTSQSFDVGNTTTVVSANTSYTVSPGLLITDSTYYWRVQAACTLGGTRYSIPSISTFTVVTYGPSQFDLITPTGTFITSYRSTMTFCWQESVGLDPGDSVQYLFRLSTSSLFDVDLTTALVTNKTTHTVYPGWFVTDTTYYWQVNVTGIPGAGTRNSVINQFVTKTYNPYPFMLVNPVAGLITSYKSSVTFVWQDSTSDDPDDKVQYLFQYSTSALFDVAVTTSVTLSVTTYTVPFIMLASSETYYWRVFALGIPSGGIIYSTPSARPFYTRIFGPNLFDLFTPTGTFITNDLSSMTFSWENTGSSDPSTVVKYDFYCSTDQLFGTYISSAAELINSTYQVSNMLNNKTYYWYVVARTSITRTSVVSSFNTNNLPPNSFMLVSPEYGIILTTHAVLSWQNKGDPENNSLVYTLYYSSYVDFRVSIIVPAISTNTYNTRQMVITENSTCYWKIYAVDSCANVIVSSITSKFIVNLVQEKPADFSLIYPVNGQAGSDINFSWQNAIDPDIGDSVVYTLYYSSDITFNKQTVVSSLTVTQYVPPEALSSNATYYWKIKAAGINDPESVFTQSQTYYFTTPAQRPKQPLNVRIDYVSGSSVTVTWNATVLNDDGTSCTNLIGYKIYRLAVLSDTPDDNFIAAVSSAFISYTDTTVQNRPFYYFVRALNYYRVESVDSGIVYVNPQNETVDMVVFSYDKTVNLNIPENVYATLNAQYTIDIEIRRKQEEETGAAVTVYRVYEFKIINLADNTEIKSVNEPVQISFNYDNIPGITGLSLTDNSRQQSVVDNRSYGIAYYDGIQWVLLNTKVDTYHKRLYAVSTKLGKYRLQRYSYASELELLNWPPKNKVITPNKDSVNDEFRIYYNNPLNRLLSGKVYDITGKFVAEMSVNESESYIWWDATNSDNIVCEPGIYVYQIKTGTRNISGTVVIAK